EFSVRRRTENMLSSALRHGTTAHLAPHETQTVKNEQALRLLGVRPLDWRAGDDAHNLSELAATVVANTLREVPQLDFVEYDSVHGGFKDTHTGKPFTLDDFKALARAEGARKVLAGSATLARVA